MLTERSYSHTEMSNILGTQSNTCISRKLKTYGVKFSVKGRGRNAIFTLTHIPDKANFKVLCITKLGFSPQTDFDKLRNFLFYLLGDESFHSIPMEKMEARMREKNCSVSRQTISRWIDRLKKLNLFCPYGEFVYYRVTKRNNQKIHTAVSSEEYSAAWRIFWQCKDAGFDDSAAYARMYASFRGVPRKQRRIEINGFCLETLETLTTLICGSLLDDNVSLSISD